MKHSKIQYLLLVLCVWVFHACTSDTNDRISGDKVFERINSSHSNIHFNNEIIDHLDINISKFDNYYSGGAVAIGDINNDELPDILFTGSLVPNKLYLNKGNLEFEDITEKAGIADEDFWSTGANIADFNGDGWMDIYICHSGPEQRYTNKQNHLFINNQDGTFSEKAKEYGLIDNSFSTQTAQIDYDLDGDLDIFLMNHSDFQDRFRFGNQAKKKDAAIAEFLKDEKNARRYTNILFINQGNNKFERADKTVGISKWGDGLGIAVADFNKDNKPDIYIANDYANPNYLYYNQNGRFEEVNKEKIGHNAHFAMGCDAADLNNDTWLDIVNVDMVASDRVRNKTLMPPMSPNLFRYLVNQKEQQEQFMFNVVQLNNGNGTFKDIGQMTGTTQTDWSWSALLADLNMDGFKDYIITNGFKRDVRNRDVTNLFKLEGKKNISDQERLERISKIPSVPQRNYVYKNDGNYTFDDVSQDWGLGEESFSNGAAYGDLDLDGDLDLVINNIDEKVFMYKNLSIEKDKGDFLKIKFDNNPKNLNAKITLYTPSGTQFQEYHSIRGYLSCMDAVVYFGLKNDETIDSLRVEWLYGTAKTYTNISSNQQLNVAFSDGKPYKKPNIESTFFTEINLPKTKINYKHQENSFDDFKHETLLPHKQSTNGPHIAVGDVNGDKLDDFYAGGALNQIGSLYLQNSEGTFKKSPQAAWQDHQLYEDMGALFFDCDNDNDLDLYVVSGGGSEYKPRGKYLMDRLYKNDGKGNFTFAPDALNEQINSSGSRIKPCDFDGDGDMDLFVGGRVVPKYYPMAPKSTLWENKGGNFIDITRKKAPDLNTIGLVTDFEWVDIDNDDDMDLVVVGEWMRIEIFEQNNGTFELATDKYIAEDTRGWWFSLAAADMDKDGDMDLVAGNLGLNNKFHASKKKPFEIYYDDFDENGVNDIILAKVDDGEQYLLRGKDCSSEQMPFIGEKFPLYEDFANATISEVLPKNKLKKSLHYSITDFSSVYLENENGKFNIKSLPLEAQFAPIQDILIDDIDGDTNLDIIIAGNLFETEIETPSYDAGTGYLMLGDGKGDFNTISTTKSGVYMPGDVRDLNWIKIKGVNHIIVTNNDDKMQVFKTISPK